MKFNKDDRIIIDLDGTITVNDPSKEYHEKPLNQEVVNVIKDISHDVNITVFTARNMRTYQGDLEKIEKNTRPIAAKWLQDNAIPNHELIMGKPWCGPNGFYVDDKNLHIDEFVFKFSPKIRSLTFDIVISFYNEGDGVFICYEECKKIERLLNINNYIFVNNGSKDTTLENLYAVAKMDERVVIVDNPSSKGYGDGYRAGIEKCTADFIITNHADNQFPLYEFVYSNKEIFKGFTVEFEAILPKRIGRPIYDSLASAILRYGIALVTIQKVIDFNGQPKFFKLDHIKSKLENAPSDFTFDLWLYSKLRKAHIRTPGILQKNRLQGESTWNRGLKSQAKLFVKYIQTAIKIRIGQ